MSRRIDIELTSSRDDGTWTWRAAGAKQPKGILDADLLYPGAQTGDVVRAEAEFEMDGITVISVMPPKAKRSEPERLEIIGPPRAPTPGVTSSLVPKSERPRRDRDRGDRGDRPDRGGRRDGGERGPRTDRPDRPRRDRPAAARDGEGRTEREPRPPREGRERPPGRGPKPAGTAAAPAAPPKPKEKRLSPGNAHRNAVLESLPPEQRPVAEQVLRGGVPAVRNALQQDNERAKAEGRPEVAGEGIIAMAEELLPRLKSAEWHDRAEAASKIVDEISLRDLRAVVAGADAAARDDETRALAGTLRDALEARLNKDRQDWLDEMGRCLDEGRLVRALRVSARPPDPASRFPADLASRLSDMASEAMAPDTMPERWATLLEAVAASPVRRSVKPVGLPEGAPEDLVQAAKQASGRVPALAAMLGIDMPPPPGPPRPVGRRRPDRPNRPNRPPRPESGPPPAPPIESATPAAGSAPAEVAPADAPSRAEPGA